VRARERERESCGYVFRGVRYSLEKFERRVKKGFTLRSNERSALPAVVYAPSAERERERERERGGERKMETESGILIYLQ